MQRSASGHAPEKPTAHIHGKKMPSKTEIAVGLVMCIWLVLYLSSVLFKERSKQ